MLTAEILSIPTAICPNRTAIHSEGRNISFADLDERSSRLASSLRDLGIKPQDRVAVLQVNTPQLIETYFACAKAGAVFLPLNFRARENEIGFMLDNAEASAILTGDRYLPLVSSLRKVSLAERSYISLDVVDPSMINYEALIESGKVDFELYPADEKDMTVLMYTSGTTGTPKGVMLNHNSFVEYVLNNVNPADPEVEEKNILTVPIYHIAGMQAVIAAVFGGKTLVLQRQFDAEEWMRLVQKEQVNRAMLVPTMLKQLLDHPSFGKYDLSSLEVITYGAAPMPLEVIKRAIQRLPSAGFINAFGQTESGATITMLGIEDHKLIGGTPEETERKLQRLRSIGKPLPGVEVKIVNEEGKDLPVGQIGEIVAKGPRNMGGYWRQEEATRTTIDPDGYLHTGDLGYVDEEGYIFLSGREKDMIKRGGEMISPEEVENIILQIAGIEDVAIIGVPDMEWGEIVRAVVVLKKGQEVAPEEIIKYCREHLASFKKPESVIYATELPRNPMGKLLKNQIRESYGQPEK